MARLGVNVDHVATLRQARGEDYPCVFKAAQIAIQNGAESITVHLREDRRHIQDADVIALINKLQAPVNLEMAHTEEMLQIAMDLRPHAVCLVPEKRQERTTEGGLNLENSQKLAHDVAQMQAKGIRVSLFLDPDPAVIQRAILEIKPSAIEIHTGPYALSYQKGDAQKALDSIFSCVEQIQQAPSMIHRSIEAHAGHGLTQNNLQDLIHRCPAIVEYNIGHSLISDAVFVGLASCVQSFSSLLKSS